MICIIQYMVIIGYVATVDNYVLYQCADSNVRHGEADYSPAYCYYDDQCQSNVIDTSFLEGLNSCCGNVRFSGHYKLTYSGDCLSCKECIIINLLYSGFFL